MTFLSHLFGHKATEDRGDEGRKESREPETPVEGETWPPDPEAPVEAESGTDASAGSHDKRTPVEFEYLAALLVWRLRKCFGSGDPGPRPVMPEFVSWELRILPFIERNGHHLQESGRSTLTVAEATLLLLAIAPHVQPDLLDAALQAGMKHNGEFPQLGGIRPDGHNFRGFLPTGETALFLLGDDNYRWRMKVRQLFDGDHFFSRKKILWLEPLPPGEPILSGKIIVSQDYIDGFVTGKPSSPHFGANFPARRIEEKRTREKSLVLNAELTRQVDDIKSWVENNDTLLYRYGMEDRVKKGYRALFYGAPGTGKTLTAGILGNELHKDVYRIDISMVVSKYIGETEKNLELLFARAEDKGWVLFFDEADALFGKRTDVRDAHDKYANQEVSYLLQRIEDYDGLIILATNKKNNIDDAFIRRFNAVLRFPFPDARDREEIWKKSLPADVRFVREVKGCGPEALDFGKVLTFFRQYELSGANIMNVVHHASLKAAQRAGEDCEDGQLAGEDCEDGQLAGENRKGEASGDGNPLVIYLSDLLAGVKKELTKENRPFVEIRGAEKLVAERSLAGASLA
jgi:hypothetical protein